MLRESDHVQPLIICALDFERAMLQRDRLSRDREIICTGPGAAGIQGWASQANPQGLVVLAGLAGALHRDIHARSMWCVRQVKSHDGASTWFPTHAVRDIQSAVIVSTASSVKTASDRQALHERTGADIVDLESEAFAQIATQRQWNWAIIRAVSDDATTTLPQDIDQWVAPTGATRIGRVMKSVVRSPRIIPALFRLRNNSRAAMTALGRTLRHATEQNGFSRS